MIIRSVSELKHYASKYYDPVKAHEYYERTKELKGRRSSAALDKEGKKNWKYVKDQIMAQRKAELTAIRENRKSQIAQFRASIKTTLEKPARKMIKVPKGASKEEREAIVKRNDRLRDLNNSDRELKKKKREEVKREVQRVRDSFIEKKNGIVAKYIALLDSEYNNILALHGKKGAKKADNSGIVKRSSAEKAAIRSSLNDKRQEDEKKKKK